MRVTCSRLHQFKSERRGTSKCDPRHSIEQNSHRFGYAPSWTTVIQTPPGVLTRSQRWQTALTGYTSSNPLGASRHQLQLRCCSFVAGQQYRLIYAALNSNPYRGKSRPSRAIDPWREHVGDRGDPERFAHEY